MRTIIWEFKCIDAKTLYEKSLNKVRPWKNCGFDKQHLWIIKVLLILLSWKGIWIYGLKENENKTLSMIINIDNELYLCSNLKTKWEKFKK